MARAINDLTAAAEYDAIVATTGFHVDPGAHFAQYPDYIDSWPVHCVAGTSGARLHPDLDVRPIQAVFRKGAHAAAYSGFEGATDSVPPTHPDGTAVADPERDATPPADGDGPVRVPLAEWLAQHDVDSVDVCGIATDHCVRATALDAARLGLHTRVLLDLTAGVAASTTRAALAQLSAAGVVLIGAPWVGDGPLPG